MKLITDIVFSEPPRAIRGPSATNSEEVEVANQLRKNPGKYAVVFECDTPAKASSVAQAINKGQRAGFGAGFKAVSRARASESLDAGDRKTIGVVYAAYLGDAEVVSA